MGLDFAYWQSQLVKSWGAQGPAKTVYDSCSNQKCNWDCLEADSCPFQCCENDLFRREHGPNGFYIFNSQQSQLMLMQIKNPFVAPSSSKEDSDSNYNKDHLQDDRYTTYEQICRGAGYRDPMTEFEGALAQYKQKSQNEVLVALKLATMPVFSYLVAGLGVTITPWVWFVVGVVWSFADWILAHSQQAKFHEWIGDMKIQDWYGTGLLDNGITVTTAELRRHPWHCMCKFMFGFVYVFLPSLITNLAALFGMLVLQGLLGAGASKDAAHAFASTDLSLKLHDQVYSAQNSIWEKLGQHLHQAARSLVPNGETPWWVKVILDSFRQPNAAFGGLMWQLTNAIGYWPNMGLIYLLQKTLMELMLKTGVCNKPRGLPVPQAQGVNIMRNTSTRNNYATPLRGYSGDEKEQEADAALAEHMSHLLSEKVITKSLISEVYRTTVARVGGRNRLSKATLIKSNRKMMSESYAASSRQREVSKLVTQIREENQQDEVEVGAVGGDAQVASSARKTRSRPPRPSSGGPSTDTRSSPPMPQTQEAKQRSRDFSL
ncbi:unnamed protein product [Amoebophrya sp. A25]|nr:unnamed protein product [Amoebophrya sp. A25]|eukprot:GSA25T00025447001.1